MYIIYNHVYSKYVAIHTQLKPNTISFIQYLVPTSGIKCLNINSLK